MATAKTSPPLSSTVSTIFDQFIQRIKDGNILNDAAAEALRKNLKEQTFGHESLRSAIFTKGKAEK